MTEYVRATARYIPKRDEELSFDVRRRLSSSQSHSDLSKIGDVIEITKHLEDGWWEGRLRGKEGLFPANFTEPASPSRVQSQNGPRRTSINNFTSESKGQSPRYSARSKVDLKEGEVS